jgi:hypothetical protein
MSRRRILSWRARAGCIDHAHAYLCQRQSAVIEKTESVAVQPRSKHHPVWSHVQRGLRRGRESLFDDFTASESIGRSCSVRAHRR